MGFDMVAYNASKTPEQRRADASKAGRASAEKKRKYKAMRDVLKQVMLLDCQDPKVLDLLKKVGLEPTMANAIALSTVGTASIGDIEAARFVRDTLGEKPTEQYNLGVTNRPIKELDLTGLTDAELEEIAKQADGDGDDEEPRT